MSSTNEIRITEGQINTAASHQLIVYPEIDSCLTITCRLSDGSLIGAHCVLVVEKEGQVNSQDIINRINAMLDGRKILSIKIAGDFNQGAWTAANFDADAKESYQEIVPLFKRSFHINDITTENRKGTFTVNSHLELEGGVDPLAQQREGSHSRPSHH